MEPSGAIATIGGSPGTAGVAVRNSALVTAAAATVALFAPFVNDGDSLSETGATTVMLFVVSVGLLVVGALIPDRERGAGLAAGAALPIAMYLSMMEAVTYTLVDAFSDFGDVSYQVGFFAGVTATVAAVITFVIAMTSRDPGAARTPSTGWSVFGVAAAAAVVLGFMLPPPDSGLSFAEKNFEMGEAVLQVAYLAFIGSLGLGGVVGFRARTRWGLAVASGTLVPVAWITFASIAEMSDEGGDWFGELHPIAPIALIAWVIALIAGYQAHSNETVTGRAPVAEVSAVGVPAQHGQWAADPYARHKLRYHNGTRWTSHVSDGDGVVGHDDPNTPPPPAPSGDSAPGAQ